jgi:hypothetical protein
MQLLDILILTKYHLSGYIPGKTFHLSAKWHQKLVNALVSIPEISPGDTVWWHPDIVSIKCLN